MPKKLLSLLPVLLIGLLTISSYGVQDKKSKVLSNDDFSLSPTKTPKLPSQPSQPSKIPSTGVVDDKNTGTKIVGSARDLHRDAGRKLLEKVEKWNLITKLECKGKNTLVEKPVLALYKRPYKEASAYDIAVTLTGYNNFAYQQDVAVVLFTQESLEKHVKLLNKFNPDGKHEDNFILGADNNGTFTYTYIFGTSEIPKGVYFEINMGLFDDYDKKKQDSSNSSKEKFDSRKIDCFVELSDLPKIKEFFAKGLQ